MYFPFRNTSAIYKYCCYGNCMESFSVSSKERLGWLHQTYKTFLLLNEITILICKPKLCLNYCLAVTFCGISSSFLGLLFKFISVLSQFVQFLQLLDFILKPCYSGAFYFLSFNLCKVTFHACQVIIIITES